MDDITPIFSVLPRVFSELLREMKFTPRPPLSPSE